MVFCNMNHSLNCYCSKKGHNPYFNRWFSAIDILHLHDVVFAVTILILIDGFLQSVTQKKLQIHIKSHNPYFNRWFSAIKKIIKLYTKK